MIGVMQVKENILLNFYKLTTAILFGLSAVICWMGIQAATIDLTFENLAILLLLGFNVFFGLWCLSIANKISLKNIFYIKKSLVILSCLWVLL